MHKIHLILDFSRKARQYILINLIIYFSFNFSQAQVLNDNSVKNIISAAFTDSDLPIILINTNGQPISDTPKIIADMSIIYNGPGVRNYLTDSANEYNGKIAIEIRGSSSQSFPKKSYGLETRNSTGITKQSVSIFGMASEQDWILSANYTDKSFCRNVLSYRLSEEMGHYAAHTKYVELVVNGNYLGIYVFMERIKRDKGRVDIAKLHPYEISQPDVTGGYIMKVDKTTGSGGLGWTSAYAPINHSNNQKIFIQYDYPSQDSIALAQQVYLKSFVDSFENALAGANFKDSMVGYPHFIGNGSWIDYFFCNELSKNVDGYRISSYLYKDKNKLLKAGPVWDYDIAWGNANYCSGSDTTGWAYLFPCTGDGYQVPFWWQKLLQDTNYTNELKCRWTNYRLHVLSEPHIYSIIDSISNCLNESKTRNFSKWTILGTYVWPNPSPQPATYAGEIQNLKNWVHRRLIWLDANIPGRCNCSLTTAAINSTCNSFCDGKAIALGASPYNKTYLWSNENEEDTLKNLCPGTYSVTMKDKIGCTKNAIVTITQPAVLAVTAGTTNATCAGNGCNGTANVSVVGGTAPYTYSWSNGHTTSAINNLCAGSYTVTVNDINSCSNSTSVSIVNPLAPVVTLASLTNPACHGSSNGSASVNVSGGIGPYNYSWLPSGGNLSSATGLASGNYIVKVTDATGCSSELPITLIEADSTIITVTVKDAICNGQTGSASAVISGGMPPYVYNWSPIGITSDTLISAAPGSYYLKIIDRAGCVDSTSFVIREPAPISVLSLVTSPSCFGDSDGIAQVFASGGNGQYQYSWSPVNITGSYAGNLSAGNYFITITDKVNCTATFPLTINDPPELTIQTTSTTSLCGVNNGTATVNVMGGAAPYNYSWSPSGTTKMSAINLNPGLHTVTVNDTHGCVAADTVEVLSQSGLSIGLTGKTQVSCYGGNDGAITLNVSGGVSPYSFNWNLPGLSGPTVSNLYAGIYFVNINEANGCITEYQFEITEPAKVSVATTATPASCTGTATGSIEAIVSGGSAPYTYVWQNIAGNKQKQENLSSGRYDVLVTDANGCSTDASVIVTEPDPVSFFMSKSDASCNLANGAVEVFAFGGAGGYRYLWSTGDTVSLLENILEGNYSLAIIDCLGCTHISSINIGGTIPPRLSLDNFSPVTCSGGNNGSATLSVVGGDGNLHYNWSPDVSNGLLAKKLRSGVYNVIVSDGNGCSDSLGFIIPQPAPLTAMIFSDNVKCYGQGNGLLFADIGGGTPPYSCLWSDGQNADTTNNLQPGKYWATITDKNNCISKVSGTISEPDSISIDFTVKDATCQTCPNGTVVSIISGGVPPYSYSWIPSNQSTSGLNNLLPGSYQLCLTDANLCNVCKSITVNNALIGIEEIKSSSVVYVYPNPYSETTVFAFNLHSKQPVEIQIYSSSGSYIETLIKEELEAGEHLVRFNASALESGVYYFQFKTQNRIQSGALFLTR
jgi:hypothetical protein